MITGIATTRLRRRLRRLLRGPRTSKQQVLPKRHRRDASRFRTRGLSCQALSPRPRSSSATAARPGAQDRVSSRNERRHREREESEHSRAAAPRFPLRRISRLHALCMPAIAEGVPCPAFRGLRLVGQKRSASQSIVHSSNAAGKGAPAPAMWARACAALLAALSRCSAARAPAAGVAISLTAPGAPPPSSAHLLAVQQRSAAETPKAQAKAAANTMLPPQLRGRCAREAGSASADTPQCRPSVSHTSCRHRLSAPARALRVHRPAGATWRRRTWKGWGSPTRGALMLSGACRATI